MNGAQTVSKVSVLTSFGIDPLIESGKVYIDGELCGTLPGTLSKANWYDVICNGGIGLKGRTVKIDNGSKAVTLSGIKVYDYGPAFLHIDTDLNL